MYFFLSNRQHLFWCIVCTLLHFAFGNLQHTIIQNTQEDRIIYFDFTLIMRLCDALIPVLNYWIWSKHCSDYTNSTPVYLRVFLKPTDASNSFIFQSSLCGRNHLNHLNTSSDPVHPQTCRGSSVLSRALCLYVCVWVCVCVIGLVSPTAEWYSHICPNREAFVTACRCGAAKTLTICLCKHLQYSIQWRHSVQMTVSPVKTALCVSACGFTKEARDEEEDLMDAHPRQAEHIFYRFCLFQLSFT